MKKQLLTETLQVHAQGNKLLESTGGKGYVVEAAGPNGLKRVKLPATTLDKKNENGRIYSRAVMEGACQRGKDMFEGRRLLSTVNEHPAEPYPTPGEASHIVTRAWCEDGYLWNEWEIMNTANGKNLQALVEAGASFGVSIRGLGSMDGYGTIQDDYEYLGTDCVGQPSARIWTAPESVTESRPSRGQTSLNTQHENREGQTTMKTKTEALRFLGEQITLMRAEPQLDGMRRLISVEDALARSEVAPRELNECYAALDKAKGELFPESSKAPATAQKGKEPTMEELKAQVAGLTTQISEMTTKFRSGITGMAETFRKSQAAMKETVAETTRRLEAKAKTAKFFEKKLTEARAELKEALQAGAGTAAIKAKYEAVVTECARGRVRFAAARDLAVENGVKYRIAVKEAARLSKAAPAARTESATATGVVRTVIAGQVDHAADVPNLTEHLSENRKARSADRKNLSAERREPTYI
jgi:hypothetical protein